MRKLIFIIISLFISISPVIAKKFDFSQIQGLSLGMKLDKALSVLKKSDIEIDITNSDNGGKIYSFVPKTDIMETLTQSIQFITKNGKITGFKLELLLDKYIELGEKLDEICNCRRYDKDDNSDAYFFDNCTVEVDYDDNYIIILDYIGKCKN